MENFTQDFLDTPGIGKLDTTTDTEAYLVGPIINTEDTVNFNLSLMLITDFTYLLPHLLNTF